MAVNEDVNFIATAGDLGKNSRFILAGEFRCWDMVREFGRWRCPASGGRESLEFTVSGRIRGNLLYV